jgi:Cu-Zn family superoxide dismutase
MRSRTVGAVIAAGVLLAGMAVSAASTPGPRAAEAKAALKNTAGNTIGQMRLSNEEGMVMVRVVVNAGSGLAPGFHGFHIHTIGICDPLAVGGAFKSAGGHFNPDATTHPSHAGDQPVLLVNEDGSAFGRFVTDRYPIGSLFDGDGSAFIVHADADNYANIPTRYLSSTPLVAGIGGPDQATLDTGDAGARSACGLIEQG